MDYKAGGWSSLERLFCQEHLGPPVVPVYLFLGYRPKGKPMC